jgi:[histone H3]-dimethyl-L-lysine9 demethylase
MLTPIRFSYRARRNEHHAKDFSPVSRFCKSELAQAITDMEALLEVSDPDNVPLIGVIDPALQTDQSISNSITSNGTAADLSTSGVSSPTFGKRYKFTRMAGP